MQPFRGGAWGQRGLTAFITLQKKRRRRIDRSMIGEPMNFVHLTHIGSGDMAAGEGLPMVPPRCGRDGAQCWGVGSPSWVTGGVFGVVGVGFGVVESHSWMMGVAGPHSWVPGVVLGCWLSGLADGCWFWGAGSPGWARGVAQVGDRSSLQTGAVQEMRSKGGRERQWSNSRVL